MAKTENVRELSNLTHRDSFECLILIQHLKLPRTAMSPCCMAKKLNLAWVLQCTPRGQQWLMVSVFVSANENVFVHM